MNDSASSVLASIIDNLREAARYARTQPDEAERLAGIAHDQLVPLWESDWIKEEPFRLMRNISTGIRVIHSNPDMLASYCRCAADELAMWADKIRIESQKGSDL